MGELIGLARGDLDQVGDPLVVSLELDQCCRLIERQLVLHHRCRRELRLGNLQTLLDFRLLGGGPLGDQLRGESLERQLLERRYPVAVREGGAVLVLDQLLDDAIGDRLGRFHDEGGDAGQSDLSCGEDAALTGAHDDVPVVVASGEDGGEYAVLADAGKEFPVQRGGRAHVRFDDHRGGVDVLDGSGGDAGVSHVVSLSLIDCFVCLSGTEIC